MQSFVCVWFFVWLGVCIKVAVSYLCGRVHIHSCLLIKNHLSMFAKCLWGILSAILLSDTHVFSNRLTFLSLCELKHSAKWGITNSLSCLLCVCVRAWSKDHCWVSLRSHLLCFTSCDSSVCVCVCVCYFWYCKNVSKGCFYFLLSLPSLLLSVSQLGVHNESACACVVCVCLQVSVSLTACIIHEH